MADNFTDKLLARNACSKALEYAANFPNLQSAWDACERGDWLLWLLGKVEKSAPWSDGRKPLLAACLDCAALMEHLWTAETANAVEVLRKWISGNASVDEAKLLHGALGNEYAVAAADAADAAADAADAAATQHAYAAAAAAASSTADAAAYAAAADAADAAAARTKSLKDSADIVRSYFPQAPTL